MFIINQHNPVIINRLCCINLKSNEVTSEYLLLCTNLNYFQEIDNNKNYKNIFLLVPENTIVYSKFVLEIKKYDYSCIAYTIYKDTNKYQLFTLIKYNIPTDTFSSLFGD